MTIQDSVNIINGSSSALFNNFLKLVENYIVENKYKKICDIGAGRNPQLSDSFIKTNNLDYTILDISTNELSLAPDFCQKINVDISDKTFEVTGQYDFAFSRMLAEHVKDGEMFYKNTYKLLKRNGIAIHFFPTLYSFPFIVNRIIPESLANKVLDLVAPRDRTVHEKFPAYYSWCFGPIPNQIRRIRQTGFDIVEYRVGFGHGYYNRIPILSELHRLLSCYLKEHPNYYFSSYVILVIKKHEQ